MVVPAGLRARGELIAKAPLVLAGLDLFLEVFRLLDPAAVAETARKDGEELCPGESPAQVRASARALLSGERVALNLLQRLSGVATLTRGGGWRSYSYGGAEPIAGRPGRADRAAHLHKVLFAEGALRPEAGWVEDVLRQWTKARVLSHFALLHNAGHLYEIRGQC